MTQQNFEIELRYELYDTKNLETFLANLTYVGAKRIVDVYFDTPDRDLIQAGIFVRNRNNKTIDIKFNRECINDRTLPMQPYCEEYTFALPLAEVDLYKFNQINESINLKTVHNPSLQEYLAINNLVESIVVDKTRRTYKTDEFIIGVDEVVGLGNFLEIEIIAQTLENLNAITERMKILLHGLALKPLKSGYNTLLLKKINFQHYVQSRFCLPEDRV